MTRAEAKTTADVILAAAGIAAALIVVTTPPLRRLAVQATRWWLGASIPAYLAAETRRAWIDSGRTA
jgi:hypothetical protein